MASVIDDRKPTLPAAFHRKSLVVSLGFIAYALAMWLLPLVAAWAIYDASLALPPLARIALMLPLLMVSGQGLHLMGWVGHEGFHFNLVENRHVSALLAVLTTAPVGLFSTVGENSVHWSHHRFTNLAGDPQVEIFPKFTSFASRLLCARVVLEFRYLKNLVLLSMNRLNASMAFSRKVSVRYARLDFFCSGLWLVLYGWLAYAHSMFFVFLIGLPHLFAFLLSAIRPYAEHAGTGVDAFHQARTNVSGWMSVVYFFNNYHLEHHLYPTVPCWKLPRVHRLLVSSGVYGEQQPIVSVRFLDWFRCAGAAFEYPAKPASRNA
jgi:fatty acid desaturase